ncbi:MAG: hypothetical protein JJU06_10335 [Ectothiorhodospiraceae bacterium]|nr:hypothetical protein [Ectothiorhodospiraceae bacterium]MCH8503049.1 hypothetical protein [Ectothiorhodospiraceae bacterium]
MTLFNIEPISRGGRQRVRAAHLRRNRIDVHDCEVHLMTLNDLAELWRNRQRQNGLTDEEIDAHERALMSGAAGHAPSAAAVVNDSSKLSRLALDLRRGGSLFSTYRIVQRGSTTLIALRGHAGLRHHLTATTYGIMNPKVISMGIGPMGHQAMARGGLVVTVVVSPLIRTFEWVFNDEVTWHHLLVHVTMDMAKAVAAAGAMVAASMATAASFAAFGLATPVVLPVAVGIFVAIAVGIGLNRLDARFEITQALVNALAEAERRLHKTSKQVHLSVRKGSLDAMNILSGSYGFHR